MPPDTASVSVARPAAPLLCPLAAHTEARLLRLLEALLDFRNRPHGRLLSEGGYRLTPAQASAGTRRLSPMLRATKGVSSLRERFLGQQAQARRNQLLPQAEDELVSGDDSGVKKRELHHQGLGRGFCHRTGKRSLETQAPLYRVRTALSCLWVSYPVLALQNSG